MEQGSILKDKSNEKEPSIVLILKEPMMAKEIVAVQEYIASKPDFSAQDIEASEFTQSQKNLLNQYLEAKNDPHGIDQDYVRPEEESGIIGSGKDQMNEGDFSDFMSGGKDKDEWDAGKRVVFRKKD